MASITSFPASSATGTEGSLPRGSARITTSARAAASAEVVATAPGATTSTMRAMRDGSPEPEMSTSCPAAIARRARTVPTLPAPRIPTVAGRAASDAGVSDRSEGSWRNVMGSILRRPAWPARPRTPTWPSVVRGPAASRRRIESGIHPNLDPTLGRGSGTRTHAQPRHAPPTGHRGLMKSAQTPLMAGPRTRARRPRHHRPCFHRGARLACGRYPVPALRDPPRGLDGPWRLS